MLSQKITTTDKLRVKDYIASSTVNPVFGTPENIASAVVNDPNIRIRFIETAGEITGVGTWNISGPTLRYVNVNPFKLNTYLQLCCDIVEDVLAEGFTQAYIPIWDKTLITMLNLHFKGLEITVAATTNGVPSQWQVFIPDLADISNQLKKFY